ncbi:hypothetical protein [Sphingomonas sp.]|uniref:hypothetical protein n=1 Tax=Sphingomonas sp. TaxID=28214 RepID=UPI003B3B9EC7
MTFLQLRLLVPAGLALACGWAAPTMAKAGCDAIDVATYFQDEDNGMGDFAGKILTLDDGGTGPVPIIHAVVEQRVRGSYRGSKIIISPSHPSACDFVPNKGEGALLVGRIVAWEDGVPVIDPLRSETARQRAERGKDDDLRSEPPPPKLPRR